jgi:replication factor A1
MGSTVSINPDIPQAFVLRGWYDSTGADQNFQSHSSAATFGGGGGAPFNRTDVMTLDDVKSAKLGESDNDTFSARATIMHIKADSIAYPACPGRAGQKCGKKVVEGSEGWRCEKCEMSHEAPEYR